METSADENGELNLPFAVRVSPNDLRRALGYREYLLNSKPVGLPISNDLEWDGRKPSNTGGPMSFANCPCGDTLLISSKVMPLAELWPLLDWARQETGRRGVARGNYWGRSATKFAGRF